MPFPWLAAGMALGTAGLNVLGGSIGAKQQSRINARLAAQQHGYNMELLKYQLDYNTPASQMGRFLDAGLNPNLVYGQGSPGNMESPPRYPDIRPADYQSMFVGLGTQIQQARLLGAQTNLTNQKVDESGVKQDLMKAQKNLVNANPYLNSSYVSAMVMNLQAIAKLKEQESSFMLGTYQKDGIYTQVGFAKMQKEMDLLFQRFNLSQADQQIKAKVLESKEFQNALQEIQVQWMKDADITPQHIYQGILLLLSRMM